MGLFDDPALGLMLARNSNRFFFLETSERPHRGPGFPTGMGGMFDEMAAGRIRRGEFSAFHARQPTGHPKLHIWGSLREADVAESARIDHALTPSECASPCTACH